MLSKVKKDIGADGEPTARDGNSRSKTEAVFGPGHRGGFCQKTQLIPGRQRPAGVTTPRAGGLSNSQYRTIRTCSPYGYGRKDAISITNRYRTSPLSKRSYASLIC